MISFTVCGDPVAQPRHKVTIRGKKPIAYIPDDHPIHAYKQAVQLAAKVAMGGRDPVEGAVEVAIVFCFARPKSHTKAQRLDDRHTQKPDLDNLTKAVLDALNGICWTDDSQAFRLRPEKKWASEAKTIIAIDTEPTLDPLC